MEEVPVRLCRGVGREVYPSWDSWCTLLYWVDLIDHRTTSHVSTRTPRGIWDSQDYDEDPGPPLIPSGHKPPVFRRRDTICFSTKTVVLVLSTHENDEGHEKE